MTRAATWIWLGPLLLASGSVWSEEPGGLRLTWSETGRVSRLRCGSDDITGQGVAVSGLAIRDCARQKTYEPFVGRSTSTARGVRLEAHSQRASLAVSAECNNQNGWLVIQGEVRNLTEMDHAVSLRFGLPVSCKGWMWHHRLHRSASLVAGRTIHLGETTPLGSGHIALRPVAAISDVAHTVGLAVPVDFIGQYDFLADPDLGLFAVVIDFAMTRHAKEFFTRVPFEIYVMVEPDGWGLRSALARYYANKPEFFRRHTPEAGGWFAWGDILRQPPPICDYGLMFHEEPESTEAYAHDKAIGIRTYPYIEPIMYQMCLGDQPEDKQPGREFIIQRLHEWARPETTGRFPSGGWRTQEDLRRVCQTILRSGVRDADGEPVIASVARYNWISGSKWAAQFPLNLTPDIPLGAGEDRLDYTRRQLLTRPYLKGIYLDSFSAHAACVNYAEDVLKYLSYAPQFDARTYKPCTLNGLTCFAWVEALSAMLPDDEKELLPNLYNQPTPFPWHRFTVMGKEHWIDPAGPLMQQYRTMGFRKVVTQLPAYEDQDERFLRNLMLLDVFPGGYARRPTDPPQGMRSTYRRVVPMLRQMHRLGWEPVTGARSAAGGVWIERYGRAPGPVALAVHNPYDSGIARLAIDTKRLDLPADAAVVDAVDASPVQYAHRDDTLEVAIGLAGNNTTLLVVGNREAHVAWAHMLADDRLDDVRLCLKEDALRRKIDSHSAWARVATLTHRSSPEALLDAAKALAGDDPTEVRARELLALAARAVQHARSPAIPPSQTPSAPRSNVTLPWIEPFNHLSPRRWQPTDAKGVRVAGGRLELELPGDATGAEVRSTTGWPFVPRPLTIETDFKFTHGEHDRYLRLSLCVTGSGAGRGEYLLVRIESARPGSATIWLENHNAPPTHWKHTLTERRQFSAERPHHLRLRLEQRRFRLEIDDQLVGAGDHECSFGWAYITLGVYSGHCGHGDVCWWDNLEVCRGEDAR